MDRAPRNVAVIDDEADVRLLVRALLERDGFRVVAEFGTAESALEAWDAGWLADVCAVVLDQRLGADRGLEVARRIREVAPELPIVLLSGHLTAPDIDLAVSLDVAVLPKMYAEQLSTTLQVLDERACLGAAA